MFTKIENLFEKIEKSDEKIEKSETDVPSSFAPYSAEATKGRKASEDRQDMVKGKTDQTSSVRSELASPSELEERSREGQSDFIDITDLTKIELRVGTIVACETVEKSDKLLKMSVDLGELGVRQILGGIRKHYQPEELIGRQGLFVCNLKPRKMLGLESHGMMLIAQDSNGKSQLMAPAMGVPNGTRLQ